jgi:hypothetical protein
MITWSQRGALLGLAAATWACSTSTADHSQGESVAASEAGEQKAESSADSDSSLGNVDSSGACSVLEPGSLSGCPLDWETANQTHCQLEKAPSLGCGYLRVPLQGVDTSTLCLYDTNNHQLAGVRFHSVVFDTTQCWGVQSGFSDPLGCQFVADTCTSDASHSGVGDCRAPRSGRITVPRTARSPHCAAPR